MYTDFLGNHWNVECMGCGLGTGATTPPYRLIYQSPFFIVHQDPLIPIPGFLVIGAKRHIQRISDMSDEEYDNFSKILFVVSKECKICVPLHSCT